MEIGCVNGVVHWPNSRILEFEPPVLQISVQGKIFSKVLGVRERTAYSDIDELDKNEIPSWEDTVLVR